MTDKIKLKPCPFCGSNNLSRFTSSTPDSDEVGYGFYCHSCGTSVERLESAVNMTDSQKNLFRKAVRAVGFLEGFGALLWTQVGPNLADEEVAEFEKRIADIAAYIGLPPREVDVE